MEGQGKIELVPQNIPSPGVEGVTRRRQRGPAAISCAAHFHYGWTLVGLGSSGTAGWGPALVSVVCPAPVQARLARASTT
jgi:hypothetical protein